MNEAVEFAWGTFSTCPISMEFEHDEIVLHEFFDSLERERASILEVTSFMGSSNRPVPDESGHYQRRRAAKLNR